MKTHLKFRLHICVLISDISFVVVSKAEGELLVHYKFDSLCHCIMIEE
jgi:hypothetical protein